MLYPKFELMFLYLQKDLFLSKKLFAITCLAHVKLFGLRAIRLSAFDRANF